MSVFGKKAFQLAVSFFFLLALLYLISTLRLDEVYKGIVELNRIHLLIGFAAIVLAASVKILRFSLVTRYYHHPVSLLESSLIQMVGISIAILTPARLGEGSKAVLLNKRAKVPVSSSFGIVIFERFFDMIFLGTGAFIFSYYIIKGRATFLIGLFLLSLLMLFIIFLRYFNAFQRLIPSRYRIYFKDVKLKNNPPLALAILMTTASTWALEAAFPWLLAASMGVKAPYPFVFGVVCISTMAVVLSVLPAGFGTMDFSFLVLFPLIGSSPEAALSILLIYRFFSIILPFALSLIILNYLGMSFQEIRKKIKT